MLFKKLNLSNQMAEFQLNQEVPSLLDMEPIPSAFPAPVLHTSVSADSFWKPR